MLNKLNFFPRPYPDEDFRSIVHRYHLRSTNSEIYETKIDLFGTRSYKNTDFPRNLSVLLERLPDETGITAELLINNHTLFPIFRPFLSKERVNNVYNDMFYGNVSAINYVGRLSANRQTRMLSEKVRYCPICLKRDFTRYGEVYAHRVHQLAFLDTCPEHGVLLIQNCPECGEPLSKNKSEILLSGPVCPKGHQINKNSDTIIVSDTEKSIQADLSYLLKFGDTIENAMLIQKLREACWEKGYFTFSGRLTNKLREDFLGQTPAEVFGKMGYETKTLETSWFWRNMVNMSKGNILLNILSMRFFFGSVEGIMKRDTVEISNRLPFGCGPWECLNKICRYYQRQVIRICNRVEIRNSVYYGHFVCNHCGMSYTRSWDWENRIEMGTTILSLGPNWEQIVLQLYFEGLKNTEIGERVGTSTAHVRQTLVRLLGNQYSSERGASMEPNSASHLVKELILVKQEVAAAKENTRLIKYREKVLGVIRENPNLTRGQVNKKTGRSYLMLKKYDREWLEGVLPNYSSGRKKLDLALIDQELSLKIQENSEQLYKSNPPTQIKKYSIINTLDQFDRGRVSKHIEKLPKTAEMITKYEESKEAYLLRHLPSIVSQLMNSGYRNVTLKSVIAFRRSYRNLPDEMIKKLEEKLNAINIGGERT